MRIVGSSAKPQQSLISCNLTNRIIYRRTQTSLAGISFFRDSFRRPTTQHHSADLTLSVLELCQDPNLETQLPPLECMRQPCQRCRHSVHLYHRQIQREKRHALLGLRRSALPQRRHCCKILFLFV